MDNASATLCRSGTPSERNNEIFLLTRDFCFFILVGSLAKTGDDLISSTDPERLVLLLIQPFVSEVHWLHVSHPVFAEQRLALRQMAQTLPL